MKIIKSSGCTAFYTDVDGVELNDLTEDAKKALLEKLIKIIHDKNGIENTINMLLDSIDYEGEDGGYCDQCGDNVYRQIYNIEND